MDEKVGARVAGRVAGHVGRAGSAVRQGALARVRVPWCVWASQQTAPL